MRGFFISGTDTGVGKSLVAGAFASALVERGFRVGVMKPVETGCSLDTESPGYREVDGYPGPADPAARAALARLEELAGAPSIGVSAQSEPAALYPADAHFLRKMARSTQDIDEINPYRFSPAVAPGVAATLCGVEIRISTLVRRMEVAASQVDYLIVEGAGGLLVPLNQNDLMIDLIEQACLPVVMVGRSTLGTINHSLLSLRALSHRNIVLAGLVLNRHSKRPKPEEAANPREIERFSGDVIRGVFPYVEQEMRQDRVFLAERLEVHVDLDSILRVSPEAS